MQPYGIFLLYKIMMECQRKGTFTEHNLLDFAHHFWYTGDYGEYHGDAYIRRSARGA